MIFRFLKKSIFSIRNTAANKNSAIALFLKYPLISNLIKATNALVTPQVVQGKFKISLNGQVILAKRQIVPYPAAINKNCKFLFKNCLRFT